jgi:2-amino-4-hydroxy-6-hydroxymethyldihydropteridine diphosphokinase
MILIGHGANLLSERYGAPRATLEAALRRCADSGLKIARSSPWYRSAPVPVSDQPWYVNGVAVVETNLTPLDLLSVLHDIERAFGRVRRVRNESRELDLDLLAYEDLVVEPTGDAKLVLPHPRLHDRAFVLYPLRDVAPLWRHPVSDRSVNELIARLAGDQTVERLAESGESI